MTRNKFVMRTKGPAQYLGGTLKKLFFPLEGKLMWCIADAHGGGGGRKRDPLTIIEYKETSRVKLVDRLKRFAKSESYIFSFNPKDF